MLTNVEYTVFLYLLDYFSNLFSVPHTKIRAAEKYLCEAPPTHQSSSLRTDKTPINKSPADDTTRVSECVRRLSRLLCLTLVLRAAGSQSPARQNAVFPRLYKCDSNKSV